jgi:hypothetical protein
MEQILSKETRPDERSESVIKEAALEWSKHLAKYAECEIADCLEDAEKALRDTWDCDTYKLARYLESRCYWGGDQELYDACDYAGSIMYEVKERMLREWVKAHGDIEGA